MLRPPMVNERATLPQIASPAAQPGPPTGSAPRLLDRVRTALRTRHYSRKTEKTYVGWIRRFVVFNVIPG